MWGRIKIVTYKYILYTTALPLYACLASCVVLDKPGGGTHRQAYFWSNPKNGKQKSAVASPPGPLASQAGKMSYRRFSNTVTALRFIAL